MHKHASTNRFYRLVWSHVHSCWVAVAEGARGRGKSASRKLTAALVGSALTGAALAAPPGPAGFAPPAPRALPAAPAAGALPTGAQVVAGQASVTQAANRMTVHQGSDKAILNWQSFDIGANAGVRFVQPNANAVALNRVLGNDPSRIYGQLSANGKVFLVNQSGVLFGASARVDVGGLIASSLALPDGDFLAGRYTFSGTSDAGAVRNEGSIRTSDGGYVALLGPSVSNAGSIVAPNGSVALGAGEQIGVDLRGDGLITLRVDRGAVAALAENSGLVQADGGRVELSAKGADALARATVNNTGVVQARGLVADGGSIRLVGDGDVQAGALDASSRNGKGGDVALEGGFVALDGTIDASGVRGGSVNVNAAGTLSTAAATSAVGRAGDGGAVSYRSAGMVIESSSASVDASGLGKGGSIGVQGDGGVLSSSSYSARSSTGVGGRIDISGNDVRLLGAQLDASGNTQGGLVRIGGAFQGGAVRTDAPDLARFVTRWGQTGNIANATSTFVGDGTAIKVGATGRAGQGGTAVVWSDRQTTMLGSVDARGAGAAGTVEISSKDELRHVGLDRIALGAGGQLLLDPKNITIGSSASAWTYQAVLGRGVAEKGTEVGNLEEGDGFGMAVALNAAGTRLAVGAPYDDGFGAGPNTASERGAVHLFSFTNANFAGATLQGTIGSGYTGGKNLNVALDDIAWFGSSVALNADATRLAVGASNDAGGLGSVRMFSFGGDQFAAPALTSTLRPDDPALNLPSTGAFGTSVALNAAGDRLAVGALYDWGANGTCNNCGAVYLFNNALATPTFVKGIGAGYGVNMTLPNEAQFGMSVAFDGSGDRLAVGAYGVNNSSGAVYLFNNTYGATVHAATFGNGFTGGKNLNVNVQQYEGFGSGLSFNSSGTRLAIGSMGAGAGNVRIVDFVDNQFNGAAITTTLGSVNTAGSSAEVGLEEGENFGVSVSLNAAGDRLVVGSPFGDGDASDTNYGYGAVRAFGLMPAPATNLAFGGAPSANATVDASMLESALDSGTSITLQANNDITLEAGNDIVIGGGSVNGSLTLQAGRSIALNSTIITGNADLTLVANETAANGVVSAYRDAGNAAITVAAGTTINAGSGRVSMTIADGAGRTNRGSGAITIDGTLLAGSVSLKNRGTSNTSNVVIGATGSIIGTGNGLIEIVTPDAFVNYAGAAGIDPGAGRYLVYSHNPTATLEGLTGYRKHYNQSYTGSAPAYASSGNWFLYAVQPSLNVSAAAAGKTYDGTTALPALGFSSVTGYIDGDDIGVLTGSLGVTGLTRNAGTYAINAGSLGNDLGYAINYTGANFTITTRVLNATISGVNKTYDGNDVADVNFGDDRIAGDILSYNSVARFADKNAGTGKTVTVTGITLGGSAAGNYTLASNAGSTSADIAKRTLTASATGLNKIYDGGTSANVLLSDNRVAGDLLSLTTDSASFQDKNAGNGKAVTVTGIALGGDDAGNYELASTTVDTHADIGKRVLNANATGLNKTYDGGTSANVVLGDDRITGDVLSLSADSASFADKNAGTGKTVTVTGIALDGQDAGNYELASTSASTSANIDKRGLAATATGVNKTYDGSNAATVNFTDNRVTGDVLEYTSTASFADKNAGNGKTVSVSGIALGGQDAGNYELASTTGTTSADILKRSLTASATGLNKTYDGGTAANVVLGDDRISGDVLSLSADSASFADKNAGVGKTVTVSGIALDGQDAGNYELASTSATTIANIDKRGLSAVATGVNKTYDGNNAATVSFTDDRIAGDVLEYSASAGFADKNVGNGKAITVTGIALGGQDAGNYELASTSATTQADITKRTLVASATGLNKTYDGGTAANVVLGDDRVTGDILSLSADSASFADKNAGSGKAIAVTGITLGGQDAGNYELASTSAGTTADIAKRTLNATASGVNKTYDGGTTATVTFGDDRVAGDVLEFGANASFADKNAGNGKAVTVTGITLGGQDAGNYELASASGSTQADITKRSLTATATGVNKTYDGGTTATVSFGDDRVAGDVLEYSASASFADKNAGNGKTVSVTGITLGGQDAGNYELASTSAGTTADIAKRVLHANATGLNKTYDGGVAANVVLGDDRVLGDVLSLSAGSASFADKNAGSGKTITVTGIALDGQDAGNYALASTSAGATADIGKRTLHAVASGVNKTYDGNTAASVSFGDDRVAGDVLAYTSTASFADRNAGNGKAVTVTGITLGGQDAGNYELASTSTGTTADIAKRVLNANATGLNKTYDGGTSANVVLGDDRVLGDVLSLSADSASFADKNAGSGKTITVTGIALDGQDAGNYELASTSAGATADIGRRALSATATGVDKVYDGGLGATVRFGDDRVAGDVLAYTSTASFADKNVGNGKSVSVSDIALGGQDAGNYTLTSTTAAASANITRRALHAQAAGVNKTYDGNTSANVTFGDDRVAGDVLAYTSSASFADKNAGSGKTVSVTGIALSGQDAGNYTLDSSTATTRADITKRTLVVGATGVNKTYDGSTAATVTFGDDRVAGDVLAYTGTASFADKNAGSGKAVSVTGITVGGQDAGNYELASASASTTANIDRRALSAQAVGVNKVYDGGTAATVRFGDDRVAGDVLAYTSSASFADKNVGSAKAVSVSGIALGGQDAGNYTLSSSTGTTTASITPRTLNVGASGIDKVYDGTTVASVTLGDDRVAGDQLSLSNSGAAFADKHAGAAKAIRVNGIALSGQDAANYTLASTSIGASAAITPRTLQVSATGVDKVYDGGTAASVVLGDDRLGNDQLSVAGNARFVDKSAGSGKTVQVNGLTLSGADAGNYRLADAAVSTKAAITQATLTVKANNATRAAGLNNPVFGYSVSGLMQGDSPAILPAFVTASSATPQSAPGEYAITVGSNATLNDYKLAFVDGVLKVTGAPPEVTRAIRATIAPVLPLEVTGGSAPIAQQQGQQQNENQERALPRVEEVRSPAGPAPVAGPRVDGTIVTLSGGTQVLTRNGGVRSAQ